MSNRKARRPNFKLFQANPAIRALQRAVRTEKSAEIFVVGGAVRDHLLKLPLGDIDVVVRGVPLKKLQSLLKKAGEVNLVGKTFGVLKFTPRKSKQTLDVALPRTEHALGTGGTRDVNVQYDDKLPLENDLLRRDFTINALAVNVKTGALVDPFNGLGDMVAERLRAVGSPSDRFQEDFSRLLRGIRFAVQFGFEFDDATWKALKQFMPHIASAVVPRELVAREFLKAFAVDPLKTVDMWEVTGAFRAVMPEVLTMKHCPQPPQFHTEGDVWTHARLTLEHALSKAFVKEFKTSPSLETLVAMFLHDVGKPATLMMPASHGTDRVRTNGHDVVGADLAHRLLSRLHFSSHEGLVDIDRVAWLIKNHLLAIPAPSMRPSTLEKYFLRDPEQGQQLLQVIWADSAATIMPDGKGAFGAYQSLRARLKKLTPKPKAAKLLVHGDELMHLFSLKSGPLVGQLLDLIRDAQLEGKVKTRQQAFTLAKRHLAKQ